MGTLGTAIAESEYLNSMREREQSTSSKNSNSSPKTGLALYLIRQIRSSSLHLYLGEKFTIPEGMILFSCDVDDLIQQKEFPISIQLSFQSPKNIESGHFEVSRLEPTKKS